MGSENTKQGFKVEDKRRFDEAGNEITVNESTPVGQASKDDKPTAHGSSAQGPEIDFSSFVMSLATQAIVQLGEMPPPAGIQIDVNVAAAKQTIDILSMMEKKTKGNLEPAEASLIEEILHTLRMSYVKHS